MCWTLAIQERDSSNAVTREYTCGLNKGGGIGGLLNLKEGTENYFFLYDGKGNVLVVLDDTQAVVASYRYDVFGNLLKNEGTLEQPYRFSTKRYDEQIGHYNFGYRFYNPITGTWMTRDPIGEAGGINLYGFVGNSAVNYYDPWGLWKLTYSAGGHIPSGPWPISAGGTASSALNNSLDASGKLQYEGVTTEATAGVWADIGVSAGVGDLSGTGDQAGPVIGIGAGRYGGVQFTLRREFDTTRRWYDPLKYIDGVSVGLGLGIGLPVNVTTPLTNGYSNNTKCAK